MAGAAASSADLPAVPDPGTVDERPPPPQIHKSLGHRIRGRMPGFTGGLLVAFVMLVLFGPVLMLALFSFNDSSIISLPWEGFTTKWYEEAWANGQARDAVTNSLIVASIVMVLSVVLGTMAAWGLTRLRFRGRVLVAGLNGAVLVVPWLIIGVAGLIFFSQIQVQLSLQTITLMHLVVTFPLVVAIVSAGLVRFQRSLEEAAIDLGANQRQMLRYVVLPQIGPSIAAASIFAFAWSFNNFEISFFTGGFEQTFPVWVFSILRQSENLPVVNAVSTVIAAAQILAVMGAWALMQRLSKSDDEDSLTGLLTGGTR
jgi:spermidine/putrescine transport system permease protein